MSPLCRRVFSPHVPGLTHITGFMQASIHDLRVNAAQLRQDVLSVTSKCLVPLLFSTAHIRHEAPRALLQMVACSLLAGASVLSQTTLLQHVHNARLHTGKACSSS